MKLKELMEKYGDYEIREFDFEEALHKLDNDYDISGICIDVLKKKPKPKSVWDLKYGDKFISINAFGDITENCTWEDTVFDEEMRSVGNVFVFLTKEDAEREVERRKVEALLLRYGGRRWFKEGSICNYYMWVNTRNSLVVGCTGVGMQGLIYFDTREQAEKAISKIGEERIKEALFEVKEC